jgi:hypothetical protein
VTIIDVNVDVTQHLSALAKAGVTDIIGYLNPHGTTSKVITPARAKAIASHQMSLALVSEGWGDFAHGDISAAKGVTDAQHAKNALAALGAPDNVCIYFAVDTDASSSQIMSLVIPYFKSIHAFASGEFRVGVYGSGAVCNACLAANVVDLAWLAAPTGWLGSKEFLASKKWVLHQGLPTHIAGVDCDPNMANGTDWGQFIPFSGVEIEAPSAQSISEAQAQTAASVQAPSAPLYDRQLSAANGAINAMLANGIHKLSDDLAALGLNIPSGATGSMSALLAKAALDAILSVKEK